MKRKQKISDSEDRKSIENNYNVKYPNFRHFHKLFKINEIKRKKTNEKSNDEIDSNHNLKK